MERVKFLAGIFDGSTDSSFQELLLCRYCRRDTITVNLSSMVNASHGNSATIADVVERGLMNNICSNY